MKQEVSEDAGPSIDLVVMKIALNAARAEAKKAQDKLPLPQQKHDTLKGDLCNGFNKIQESWKEKVES